MTIFKLEGYYILLHVRFVSFWFGGGWETLIYARIPISNFLVSA